MWPQQQPQPGQQAMPIPLQPGQYPTYSYNNNIPPLGPPQPQQIPSPLAHPTQQPFYNNNNHSSSSESPISIGGGPNPTIEQTFKRQNDGPILWFAGPPLNVLQEEEGPIHSLAYLDWKQKQAQGK